MKRKDHDTKHSQDQKHSQRTEPRHDEKAPQRGAAPPIEREHETYAGVFEEDEKREREDS